METRVAGSSKFSSSRSSTTCSSFPLDRVCAVVVHQLADRAIEHASSAT